MGVKLSQVQSLWNGNKWGGEDWGFWVQLVLDSKGSVESKYHLVKNFFHKWDTWERFLKGKVLRKLPTFPQTKLLKCLFSPCFSRYVPLCHAGQQPSLLLP